jgi:hypothetical protein
MYDVGKFRDVPYRDQSKEQLIEYVEKTVHPYNEKRTANYSGWIRNYALILVCGTFDNFLSCTVEEVLHSKMETSPKSMDFFEKTTITEKLKFYNNVLGIDHELFFNFSIFNDSIRKQYKNFKQEALLEIYKKRNKAAHTTSPVVTDQELNDIVLVLEKLIVSIAWNLKLKHNVEIDSI